MTATNHDDQLREIYPTMLNELQRLKTIILGDVHTHYHFQHTALVCLTGILLPACSTSSVINLI